MPDPKQDPAETARAGSATLVLTSIKGYNTGPFLDLLDPSTVTISVQKFT